MGKLSEAAGETRWINVCNEQGWGADLQVLHLEAFIRGKGLMNEFAQYAEEVAAEENKG